MSESFDALKAQKDAMVQRQANAAKQAWMRSLMCEAHKEYVIPACDCPGCAHASGVVPPAPSGAPTVLRELEDALLSVRYIGTAGDVILSICGHFVRLQHESKSEIGVEQIAAVHRFAEVQRHALDVLGGVTAPAPSAAQPEPMPKTWGSRDGNLQRQVCEGRESRASRSR